MRWSKEIRTFPCVHSLNLVENGRLFFVSTTIAMCWQIEHLKVSRNSKLMMPSHIGQAGSLTAFIKSFFSVTPTLHFPLEFIKSFSHLAVPAIWLFSSTPLNIECRQWFFPCTKPEEKWKWIEMGSVTTRIGHKRRPIRISFALQSFILFRTLLIQFFMNGRPTENIPFAFSFNLMHHLMRYYYSGMRWGGGENVRVPRRLCKHENT